mmetsp:Transcript_4025/g.5288  ORF Transcript_4025/g.5288 Transcript_4025/m.5288 type:complete len:208 (+) Transcript_4025:63-686(+)|eukprot:CAMPEP_0198137434 /NCGR_PEP_ID=MMETSP1443-20131203/915_1 /TAXON_ID=186043 /ORGANISM="Entomoneis sp., Strain CCMP2396" /LENGTH=207 /DNA_ID=CAMNT_0043798847 /DNA_START=18 /DNA_END=641 /DNA_ORIENTATION=+
MMSIFSIVLLLFVLMTPIQAQSSFPLNNEDFHVRLSDKNFEHETQASTGQTTGSWLVYVYKPGDQTPFEGDAPEADFWTERHIVLAALNARSNPSTIERFHDKGKLPVFLFIHKNKYYKLYEDSVGSGFSWDELANFAVEGHQESEAFDIPAQATTENELARFWKLCRKEFFGFYFAPYILFFGLIVFYQLFPGLFETKKVKDKKQN